MATRGLAEQTGIDRLVRATGRNVLTASSGSQEALEGYQGRGVFAHVLLAAPRGQADGNRNDEVSISDLAEYVGNEAPKITNKVWGHQQYPMQNLTGINFPVASSR